MRRITALLVILLASPALAVQTSHWTHNSEADFQKGTMHNVVATNLGDVKLSRAVKTILEEDAKVSAVYAMVEAADGTLYAATGPHGVLLKVKGDKASPVAEFDDNSSIFALLMDAKGSLLIGVSGEKGKVYRLDHPGDADSKPVEVFADNDVQYIWGLQSTPDGNLYIATGPSGKLFELSAAGNKSILMSSDESNLLSLLTDGKDTLYVGTDPNGLVYRVNRKSKEVFVLFDAPESEISCLALDRKGNLYVGTAEAAEPAVRAPTMAIPEKAGRPEGTGGIPLPSTPPELPKPPVKPDPNPGEPEPIPKASALLPTRANRYPLIPMDPANLVGSALPTIFSDSSETIGIANPAASGDALNMAWKPMPRSSHHRIDFLLDNPSLPNPNRPGDKPKPGPTTAPATASATPNTTMEAEPVAVPKPQGNAIYRIDPDGFVTEIFRQPVLVMSMLEKDGSLLVGTGSDGLIYQVNPAAEETVVLAKVEPKQVLSLLASRDGRVLLGLANVGGIEAMEGGFAAEGTLTSPVLDATQISRFGKIRLHGSLPAATALTLATRSGNVQDPSKTGWSPWSDEMPAVEFVQVPSPTARFMQYRLTLASRDSKSTPLLNEVDVAYQMPNLAPVVKAVKVGASTTSATALVAAVTAAATPGATPTAPSPDANRIQTISWEAEDANGDALQYSLSFRSGSKSPWILLKDKLTDTHFDWDTRTVADGRYEIRVIASDAAANPPGMGKTGTRVSNPVVIDNTPPVIGDVKSTVAGSEVTVSAKAVDRTSIVSAIEYAVDSSTDWQLVLPSNKIFDSPEETVNFTLRGLSAGAHQITLRATDGKGNQVFETVLVTIDPPTAQR
jgi:WD40 repeat protein